MKKLNDNWATLERLLDLTRKIKKASIPRKIEAFCLKMCQNT